MANVKEIDRGWAKIKREIRAAQGMNVAVGILEASKNAGQSIAEYAAYNEFGTQSNPARPFMSTAHDENAQKIQDDFLVQSRRIVDGSVTARAALTVIGQRHAQRIQRVISGRDILPRLSERTIKAKRGSTKTLIDTGAMVNSVQIEIRKGRR